MCENEYTLAGWAVDDFNPEDLIEIEGYCFTSNDAGFLYDGHNPYTGNRVPKETLMRFGLIITEDRYESDEEGNEDVILIPGNIVVSPLPAVPRSMDHICFYSNRDPFVKYVSVPRGTSGDSYIITDRAYSSINLTAVIVFRVLLKQDYKNKEKYGYHRGFIRDQFESIELIHDPFSESPPRDKKIDFKDYANNGYTFIFDLRKKTHEIKKIFVKGLDAAFKLHLGPPTVEARMCQDENFVRDLHEQEIKLKSPITVYRGLAIDYHGYDLLLFNTAVGDTVTISAPCPLESWSSDICVATAFAVQPSSGLMIKHVVGYLLSFTAEPEEVVIDFRLLKLSQIKSYTTQYNLMELLVLGKERRVVVEAIFFDGGYITSTKLLKNVTSE